MTEFWLKIARSIVWNDGWVIPAKNDDGRRQIHPQYALDYMQTLGAHAKLAFINFCFECDLEDAKHEHPTFYAYHINRDTRRQP